MAMQLSPDAVDEVVADVHAFADRCLA